MDKAAERVGRALQGGEFRHVMVTSRAAFPVRPTWDGVRRTDAKALRPQAVPVCVRTYAPINVAEVTFRIQPLVATEPLPSPLFLRFAIEQAAPGELGSTDEETLVLSYVETLRKDRADLSASDMRRAASLAAVEAVGGDGVPREIDLGVLRGILKREASDQPSISAVDNKDIPLGEVLSALISSGTLTELRLCDLVRFTYDPVAEILAERWKAKRREREVRERPASKTPIAAQ